MTVYLFNLLSLPLYRTIIKNKKSFCTVAAVQMFLILACRSVDMGVDISSYEAAYRTISSFSFLDILKFAGSMRVTSRGVNALQYEIGYVVLNWLCGYLGLGFHAFLVLCAAINMSSFGLFIYKYSDSPCSSFLIFAAFGDFFLCFTILRQLLAVSIFLFSVPYIVNGNRKRAILIYLLACAFHRSAFFLLPVMFLQEIKINKKMILCFFAAIAAFSLLGRHILQYIVFPLLRLIGKGDYTKILSQSFILPRRAVVCMVILAIIYIVVSDEKFNDKFFNLSIWVMFIQIIVNFVGVWGGNLLRGQSWFSSFLLITLPSIISSKEKSMKLSLYAAISSFMIVYMILFLTAGSAGGLKIVPYISIWRD